MDPILGKATGDFLIAGNEGNEIRGLGGNDTILGGEGLDTLNGNDAQDLVIGRFGADRVYGGQGNDTVIATGAGMIVNGNKGEDLVIGFGNSTVYGGQANDTIYGAVGVANGDLGADLIFGGATITGGADPDIDSGVPAGNDTLVGSVGVNVITGGRGDDQFVFQPQVVSTFNLTFERPLFTNITGANQVTVTEGGYGGADVINDFQAGPGTGDIVKLVALDFGSTVTIAQVGDNTVITIVGTTSPDGLGANVAANQSAAQTITLNNVNVLDFLATGSNDLEINGLVVNTSTPGLVVVNPNNNDSFRFTVGARQGRNIDLSRTGLVGTRLDADFSPTGVPLPSVNNDTILGTGGADSIAGLAGNDSITAASSNDTVFGNAGNDIIFGNGGDAPKASAALPVSPDNAPFVGTTIALANITDIIYGDFAPDATQTGNDTIFGDGPGSSNEGPDFIDAGPGDDLVFGNGGDDVIFGGAGNDTISGNVGNDTVFSGGGNDFVDGNEGNDSILGGDGADTLSGNIGNDTIYGGAGNDSILGDDGDDVLFGEAGNDAIYGGAGNDTVQGGVGSDTLNGGDGVDVLSYADFTVAVTVTLPELGATANVTVAPDTNLISQFENVTGGTGNDILTGNSGPNILTGGAGNDNIFGLGGGDTLFGNEGDDLLDGGAGIDLLVGAAGDDILIDNIGGDILFGGGGDDLYIVAGPGTVISENDPNGGLLDVVRITGGGNYSLTQPTLVGGAVTLFPGVVVPIPPEAGPINPNRFANIERIEIATPAPIILPGAVAPFVTIAAGIPGVNLAFVGGPVTFSSPTGIAGDDSIVGTLFNDNIVTEAGADTIVGGLGADNLEGGSGSDVFIINAPADLAVDEAIDGESQDSFVLNNLAKAGDVILFASATTGDTLNVPAGVTGIEHFIIGQNIPPVPERVGGVAFDISGTTALNINAVTATQPVNLVGNFGNNVLTGSAFNDNLFGNSGDDILNGGLGVNGLNGGEGDDLYIFDAALGVNIIVDPSGFDTVQATASINLVGQIIPGTIEVLDIRANTVTITGAQFANFSRIVSAGGNLIVTALNELVTFPGNKIEGVIGRVEVTGSAGDDIITGFGGNDLLNGTGGNDRIAGQGGNDVLTGGLGADTIIAGSDNDTIVFNTGDSPAFGNLFDVIIDFDVTNDRIDLNVTGFGGVANVLSANTVQTLFGNANINALFAGPLTFGQVDVNAGAITGSYIAIDSNNDGAFGAGDDIISLGGLLPSPLTALNFI